MYTVGAQSKALQKTGVDLGDKIRINHYVFTVWMLSNHYRLTHFLVSNINTIYVFSG